MPTTIKSSLINVTDKDGNRYGILPYTRAKYVEGCVASVNGVSPEEGSNSIELPIPTTIKVSFTEGDWTASDAIEGYYELMIALSDTYPVSCAFKATDSGYESVFLTVVAEDAGLKLITLSPFTGYIILGSAIKETAVSDLG